MKANELMIGDWVKIKDLKYPIKRISCIDEYLGIVDFWDDERLIATSINNVLPIPLTREILEKNGFYWGHTSDEEDFASAVGCSLPEPMWTYDEGDGSVQVLFPNKSDGGLIKLSDQNFDRDMEFVFCKDIYVHHLQHVMRLCGIDKEIVL